MIGADLFVEMTLCSEQTATLIKSFSKTLLMWSVLFCRVQKTKYAHMLHQAVEDWRENPKETSRNRRTRSTMMKVSGNILWTIGGRHVPGRAGALPDYGESLCDHARHQRNEQPV